MGAPGFDDAPMVNTVLGTGQPVQFIYPYYENPDFLAKQLDLWASYPQALRSLLSAIIVDDGSPLAPASRVLRGRELPFPIMLYRILIDVRWNWLAARNIGMHHATHWCLLTDMDHMVPPVTASRLVRGRYEVGTIYRLSRTEAGRPIHPHPNSMFMTRRLYWKIGGYDEALSGHYGTDGDWRRRCAAAAPVRTLTDPLDRHEHEGDSSTVTYQRKQPVDAGKKAIIARRGLNWRPRTLSFPYERVVL